MRLGFHMCTFDSWAQENKRPRDLGAVFSDIKSAGYDGVELGGDEQSLGKPEALKKLLANSGLELAAFGCGVTANPWPPNTESYRKELDYAGAMDMKTIAVCGGFVAGRRNMFDADYKLFAENLAAAQDYAAQYGQHISFHPHLGCMVETREEFDRLLKFIPGLNLCIDTGHLIAVHCDPVRFALDYGQKLTHIHLKDWDTRISKFTELGDGNAGLDFRAFMQALDKIKYGGWVVVERDSPPIAPLESAKISRRFLKTLGY